MSGMECSLPVIDLLEASRRGDSLLGEAAHAKRNSPSNSYKSLCSWDKTRGRQRNHSASAVGQLVALNRTEKHRRPSMIRSSSAGSLVKPDIDTETTSRSLGRTSSSGAVGPSRPTPASKESVSNRKALGCPLPASRARTIDLKARPAKDHGTPQLSIHGAALGSPHQLSKLEKIRHASGDITTPSVQDSSGTHKLLPNRLQDQHELVPENHLADTSQHAEESVQKHAEISMEKGAVDDHLADCSQHAEESVEKHAEISMDKGAVDDQLGDCSKHAEQSLHIQGQQMIVVAQQAVEIKQEDTKVAEVIGSIEVNFLSGEQLTIPVRAGQTMASVKSEIIEHRPIANGLILQLLLPDGLVQGDDTVERYIGVSLTAICTRLPLSDEARILLKRLTLSNPEEDRIGLIEIGFGLSAEEAASLVELLVQVQPKRLIWRSVNEHLKIIASTMKSDLDLQVLDLHPIKQSDIDEVLRLALHCPALQRCQLRGPPSFNPRNCNHELTADDVRELRSKIKATVCI